jgi:hypothetical protein
MPRQPPAQSASSRPRAARRSAGCSRGKAEDQKYGGAVLLLDEAAHDGALSKIELTDLWGIADPI